MLEQYDVVLASKSPRRQQLLSQLGIKFRVELIEGIQENYPADMVADDVAQFLAIQKAKPYNLRENELLITADTIVVLDGHVLGKPIDEADAHRMLRALSGKVHHVVTGVCVTTCHSQQAFADTTQVEFAQLTDDEIDHYIQHDRPMDKAGAYGIQEWIGHIGVKRIDGCFYNVMGLPVPRLYALLKTL